MFDILGSILYWNIFGLPFFVWFLFSCSVALCYFSKFYHLRNLGRIFKKNFSANFGVMISCVGGALGMGNIIGGIVSVKIAGPGVLPWILILSVFISVVKFYEVFVSSKFGFNKNENNDTGPFYYVKNVFTRNKKLMFLNKWVYLSFVILMVIGYFAVTMIQINQVVNTVFDAFKYRIIFAIILAVFLLYSITSGLKRIISISVALVPVMVLIQLYLCFSVIGSQTFDHISSCVKTMFANAFDFKSGMIGLLLATTLQRMILAADIGTGISGVLAGDNEDKVVDEDQALLAAFEPICVGVIMFFIGFAIYVSGVNLNDFEGIKAFDFISLKVSKLNHILFLISVVLFGLTTAITRCYASLRAFLVLLKGRFKYIFYFTVFLATTSCFLIKFTDLLYLIDVILITGCVLNTMAVVIFAKRIKLK